MKKRNVLALLTLTAAFGMGGCGNKDLVLTTNQIDAELGGTLDTAVTSYVADADVAAEATIDFSAVDMTKTGTYSAIVTYKDQTADLTVVVSDTTAPVVEVADSVVVAVGAPLYAENVITGITELSGSVDVTFSEPEAVPEQETVETTELAEDTEAVEETESAETVDAEFTIGNVTAGNASVIYPETGEYDNTLTVTDASGNSTDVTVHIVVGDAPEIEGVEDMTVAVGTDADEIDYLDGVTATDSNGNDITANIVCDSAAVDLETAGEYEITYTVTDENGFTATKKATVMVEEKSGKKSDSKKSDSGKAGSKTDSSKKGNSSSSGNGNAASAGTSENSNASDTSSGNNSNVGNSNSGNSSNSNQTSSGNNTSGDTGNASTPSTDNSSNTSTPSTDNGGSTATPSTPAPAPEAPSTDTGSSSGGGMTVPDGIVIEDYDTSENIGTGGQGGGGGITEIDPYN